jgi:hypothetical protein
MFDLIPGMELTPAAPAYTLKPPESAKSPIQVNFLRKVISLAIMLIINESLSALNKSIL